MAPRVLSRSNHRGSPVASSTYLTLSQAQTPYFGTIPSGLCLVGPRWGLAGPQKKVAVDIPLSPRVRPGQRLAQDTGRHPARKVTLADVIVCASLQQVRGNLIRGDTRDGDDRHDLIATAQFLQTIQVARPSRSWTIFRARIEGSFCSPISTTWPAVARVSK